MYLELLEYKHSITRNYLVTPAQCWPHQGHALSLLQGDHSIIINK